MWLRTGVRVMILRKIRKLFSQWYIQLFLVLLTTIMGFVGYTNYYQNMKEPMTPSAIRIQTFFSTLKLFTLGFDVDNNMFKSGVYPNGQNIWILRMLQTARFIGLFLTGTTLFKVLSSHFTRVKEQIRFFIWNFRSDKLMLIGSNEDNCRLFSSARNSRSGMIIGTTDSPQDALADQGIRCVRAKDIRSMLSDQIRKTINDSSKKTTIIINTRNEELNLELSRTAIDEINSFVEDDIKSIRNQTAPAGEISKIIDLIENELEKGDGCPADPEGSLSGTERYGKLIRTLKEKSGKVPERKELQKKIGEIEEKLSQKAVLQAEPDKNAEIAAILKEIKSLCMETNQNLIKSCLPAENKVTGILKRIRIVVFGDREYQAIYRDLQQGSFCPVKCLNKYKLTAYDFVSRYPMTHFIPEHPNADQILTDSGCVSPDSEFNMILIGFGDTNQEIFTASFASNQFVQYVENGIPELKPVHYYIFDKDQSLNAKNLNHDVFRYSGGFLPMFQPENINGPDPKDYLPFPPDPIRIDFHPLDINHTYFYTRIRQICTENPLSINHVVIAYSDDLNNIDLALRLYEKKREWGLDNLHIFTKVRDPENEALINSCTKSEVIPFGSEDFSLEDLLEDEIERMASEKSRDHSRIKLINQYPGISQHDCTVHSEYEWLTLEETKRMSSVFNFIGLRLKLNLIGFDYEKQQGGKPDPHRVTLQDFAERYSNGDPAMGLDEGSGLIYSYNIIEQRENFTKNITRKNLGVQEHYRWNAYMIMNGFVPGTIQQIRKGQDRDYQKRFHTNLTTMDGLFTYRELKAKFQRISESDADTINRDYQQMDGAWAYLNRIGYDVVWFPKTSRKTGFEKPISVNINSALMTGEQDHVIQKNII